MKEHDMTNTPTIMGDYERCGARRISRTTKAIVGNRAYAQPTEALVGFTVLHTDHPEHPFGHKGYDSGCYVQAVYDRFDQSMVDVLKWINARGFKPGEAYLFDDREAGSGAGEPSWSKTRCYWFFAPQRAADAMLFKLTFGGAA